MVKLDTGTWRLSASLLASDGTPMSAVYDPNHPANWLGALAYGNTYTGDTIVQRGTLQLEFAPLPVNYQQNGTTVVNVNNFQYASQTPTEKHLGVINPRATQPAAVLPNLQLGSPAGSGQPGGGTLELEGGDVQRNQNAADPQNPGKFYVNYSGAIQDFGKVTVNSGANTIDRLAYGTSVNGTTNSEFVYIPDANNLIHNIGGTLNLTGFNPDVAGGPIVKIGPVLPNYVNGILNGWVTRDDNWVLPTQNVADIAAAANSITPNYQTPYSLVALTSYTGAIDNQASNLQTNSNVLQNGLFTQVFSNGSFSAGNQRVINSIKFDGVLAPNFPNKQFRISQGDDPSVGDYPSPPTVMALSTGGLLSASTNGLTQIYGGAITSGSGDFSVDATDPNNPKLINRGGGTLGQSEIFAIIRSPATAPLYLSSSIVDYFSQYDPSNRLSVGLTKSGTGTLILLDSTSNSSNPFYGVGGPKGAAGSNYQGDTYINEGTLVIRANSALGATIDYPDFHPDPVTGLDVAPNYNADGTHGQTYLLGTTSILDFQGVRYTLPEKININQGKIQASIGRSTFAGVITNLNEEQKAVLDIGTYLELNGSFGSSSDGSGTDGFALRGVGGFQKIGNGLLVVNGNVLLGVDANGVASTSEFPGSGDIQLDVGNSSWNGTITMTNGSINVTAGQHSFNGLISITNGHLANANSLVAFTKAGQQFTVELQQSGANAQTLFGNLSQLPADGAQVYTGPLTVGAVVGGVSQPGGAITILGSIDFGTSNTPNPVDLTRGTLNQISTINAGYVPTTRFFGPVTLGLAGTTTNLYHNTIFNSTLTLGQVGSAVNLVTNGIGHTTFNGAVNVVNGNLTLTDTSFTLPYTQASGTLTLNGVDTFNKNTTGTILPALTITGGTVVETGTRRAIGVYSPRNIFNGDLTIAPPAALNTTLAMTFSSNNDIGGFDNNGNPIAANINITGAAPLPGITLQRADITFANAQTFTGSLIVNGGQVTITSSGALGTGSVTPGTAGAVGGVTLQGEKSVLNLLRGVETATGEDITIGPSATAYLSGVAVTNAGSTYTAGSPPTITISGGGAGVTLQATGTATLGGASGTNLLAVNLTGVGTGYSAVPTIGQSSGNGSVAPVFGGVVIHGVDQHNVIDGSIILNNVTGGKLNLGVPLLSVGQDDTLQIKGDIFGTPTISQANTAIYNLSGPIQGGQLNGRFMTTALLGGGALNSSSGIIILSGQVKDTSSGPATVTPAGTASNILNTEWVGSNDLNIQVEKPWDANGLIQMAQGVMRYTNPTAGATFWVANGVTPSFALSVPNTAFGHASVGFNSVAVAGQAIQTAAFFLTQPGQIFNAPSFSVYLGNSNKVALDGSSTGFVAIGGENTTGTVTYGTHLGSISLDTDISNLGGLRDLRLVANAGGTVDIQNAFVKTGSGQISIDKIGDGTVWLSGSQNGGALTPGTPVAGTASTLDKAYVLGGTLELRNFGMFTGARLGTTTQLTLGGGTLRLFTGAATGSLAATGAITQSAAGNALIRNGLSSLQVQTGGSFTSTLAIGSATSLTRNIGGAVSFELVGAGATITMNVNGPTKSSTSPIYWSSIGADINPTGAQAATNFAYIDPSSFVVGKYVMPAGVQTGTTSASLDNLTSIAVNTQNIEEFTSGFTGTLAAGYSALNTVRFNGSATAAGAGTLNLGNQTITLGVGSTPGAIMLASNATGNNRSITGGIIQGLGSNDIVLQNWGGNGTTAPELLVSAILQNSAVGIDNPVTIVGDGTTVLTGANTFRGSVYLSGGTLEVASSGTAASGPLGVDSANPAVIKNLFLDGGTLHTTGDFTWTNRNIVVYGDRSTIKVDAGKTFMLVGNGTAGGINSQSPEVLNANNIAYGSASSSASSGTNNLFEGDLVISGGASGATAGGTFLQVRDVANTIAGQVFVTGNGRLAFEGNNFGWLGNNVSWMDGTTVTSGSTLEVRPTVNSAGSSTVGEWIHLNGAGQPGAGGALVMKRPSATVNAAFALTDHTLSWTGPVTLDGPTTIFVDDSPEITVPGVVGQLTFDDNIFDGGTNLLTKTGAGILRFNNGRIQNLGSILVSAGEVRFEGGILGTIGSEANKIANGLLHTGSGLAPAASFNNFTSGTNSITVGTGASSTFATGGRLSFVNVPGTHNADIALNNGFLYVQSLDAPLQSTSFAGDFTLTGPAGANAIEATYTTRVNPIVMFGAFTGTGGFTKFGNNELDFVNPNNTFSGEIVVATGGGSITSPGVALFDGGAFTNVSAITLTNGGSFFLDNRHSLDASTGIGSNDNQNNRINDNAAINLGGASRFRMLGNANAATFETVGVLNVRLGSSAVTFDPATTTQNIGLSFQNYTRDPGGVVNFRVLKTGVDFGTGVDQYGSTETTGAATITLRGTIAPSLFQGGAGLDRLGGVDPQSTSIVVGAFGSVVTRNYATLPTNVSVSIGTNNNDQPFAGRGMMTIESVTDSNNNVTQYLRPLRDSEYLNAGPVRTGFDQDGNPLPNRGIRVTDTYDFDALYTKGAEDPDNPGSFPDVANGTNKNVRLIGGFGPSTSAIAEALFATEASFLFDQRDDSRKQDSLYRVLADVTFNSLTFAQQTTEIVDGGGNRIILEISPDKTLTIGSGMVLAAGLGVIGAAAPNVNFTPTESSYIRGGRLEFGTQEAIIQNVAAGLNETTGIFTGGALTVSSPIANLNISPRDLTISSIIDGSGGLTKSGPSPVNLSGANTYSGDTHVVEGVLRLENNQALGNSHLVVVSGTGELRMQRGITVGDPNNPHALQVQFTAVAQPASFRAEAGNNLFYGDIAINTLNAAGDRVITAANPYDVSIINGTGSSFGIGGDIFGLNTASGGINPLDDVQRGRQARIVNFNNASPLNTNVPASAGTVPTGGVIQIRGSFRDTQAGSVTGLVESDNEEQVLRSAMTGTSNSNVFVYSSWDSAGSILLRQGALRLMGGLPGVPVTDFFTKAASNAINPSNAQAHPQIGDQAGLTGDVTLTLTTAGQDFNSPTLQIINNSTSNVTIGGENTTGTIKFFAPSASDLAANQFNDATRRISSWDRNVRLLAAPGGTVEIDGKITDNPANNNGSLTKVGSGTVIMAGMDGATAGYVNGLSNINDFDKGIYVDAGKLVLSSNVASNTVVANIWGVPTTQLTLAGGKLEIQGSTATGVRALDVWNNTVTIRNGSSEIALTPLGGGGITLTLGANGSTTTRLAGGTVNFATSGSTGVISYLSTANVGLSGAILGPWASFGAMPGTATDFAATATGDATRTVVGFGSLTTQNYTTLTDPTGFNSGQYANEGAGGFNSNPLNNNVKLIRFQAPSTASTLNLRASGVTLGTGTNNGLDEGAILVPTGTTALKTITGGDLQVNSGKELFIFNYGTGGLNLSAAVIGASPIVLSGPGTTTLGRNKQSGNVYLNEGVTSVDKLNFEPATFGIQASTAGQTSFTLSSTVGVRTGSAVTDANGVSLGTVLSVSGSSITVNTAPAVGTSLLVITPTTPVTVNLNLTGVTTGSSGTLTGNQVGVAVGAAVSGTGVTPGTVVTGLSGTSISFSVPVSSAQNITLGVPNGLGLATSGSGGLNINGGDLQYTGNTVQTDRIVSIGDAGATIEVTQAGTSMQLNQLVTTANVVAGLTGNPNGGGLIKNGPGTLIVSGASGANTYTGLTDVKAGTLTVQNGTISGITAGPLGSSTNALDGTVVRNAATLRFQYGVTNSNSVAVQPAAVQEWMTLEGGSTVDFTSTSTVVVNSVPIGTAFTLDGVIGVASGTTNFTFSGLNAGSSTVALNTDAGYLFGSGVIAKGTVNNGPAGGVFGGTLVINESNPLFRGGFNIEGGSLIIKSVGNPTGTGAAGLPINLGTSQVNDLSTSTSKGSPEARLIFQMRDLVDANGGTTATGAPDSFQINVGIPQDIIVNRPADALPGTASTQVKKIGVVGTGLSLDQYNLNGNLHLRDDLQFYVEDSFANINALEEYVNFNINGHIVSDGPVDPNTGQLLYVPTFKSVLNITGRPNGSLPGVYNNLYAVVSLNNSNPGFIGNLTVGNTSGTDASGFPVTNPDANHVLRLNNDLALNASNKVSLLNNVTLQVPGHNVTIGSLLDGTVTIPGTDRSSAVFSGGTTTGYITQGITQIVENSAATPSILTINQTDDANWAMLFRDGFTADGARTGSLALVKTGPALVRITNANDFSGGLTVLGGTVLVHNSSSVGSPTGSGKVDVIGAAFGGDNASAVAGDLTFTNSGSKPGVLTPGDITPEGIPLGATLSVNNLKFAGPSRYEIDTFSDESSGANDRVFLTSLEVDAPVELVLRLRAGEGSDSDFGHLFTPGDPVDLSGGEYIRLFAGYNGAPLNPTFGPNGFFTYNGQVVGDGSDLNGFYLDENLDPTSQKFTMRLSISGTDIRLTAVPEPNAGLTLAIGVGALLGLQRFRRRGRA